ncbi:MAG: AraC family transcriptional regulator [Bacteroidota bacterium]
MELRNKREFLDNLEFLSLKNQKSSFPEHFHETYCVSLIYEGTEIIQIGNKKIYSEAGRISICNPYEIHANPIFDADQSVSFDTFYPSQDVVKRLLGFKALFHHTQSPSSENIRLFREIKSAFQQREVKSLEHKLAHFLRGLRTKADTYSTGKDQQNARWSEIMYFIDGNLEGKITIEMLAHFMGMNKFNFAKGFRTRFGMSPINFVLMKKIFAAKALINPHTNLTELAYQFDFADQAHFSRTFKRFIGISPRQFRATLS